MYYLLNGISEIICRIFNILYGVLSIVFPKYYLNSQNQKTKGNYIFKTIANFQIKLFEKFFN